MSGSDQQEDAWIARWLDAVSERSMTQRRLSSIEAHGCRAGLVRAARARGIHLVQVTDEEGNQRVAASRHPFDVLFDAIRRNGRFFVARVGAIALSKSRSPSPRRWFCCGLA